MAGPSGAGVQRSSLIPNDAALIAVTPTSLSTPEPKNGKVRLGGVGIVRRGAPMKRDSIFGGTLTACVTVVAMAAIMTPGSPANAQMEQIRDSIVTMCHDAWHEFPQQEEQCQQENLREVQNFVDLLNTFPPDSEQYRVMIRCSQQYADAVTMWMMCADAAMPEEPAFRAFDTGPSVQQMMQQFLDQNDPTNWNAEPVLPPGLAGLPDYDLFNPDYQTNAPIQQQPQPQARTAPQRPTGLAPAASSGSGGAVYVPGAPRRQ